MARLDKFLVLKDCDNHFGDVIQCILLKPMSDHCPILLEGGGGIVRGLTPFRFENMWLKEDGFKDLAK